MAVTRALTRLVAGAEVALAVSVLAACAGSNPAPQSAGVSSSAAPPAAAEASGAPPAVAGQQPAAGGGQRPNPTPTRASLFGALQAAGVNDTLSLQGVPDGATCTATAHRKNRSEQLAIKGEGPTTFVLVNPPAGATIEWSATCTLGGESRTVPFETTTDSSQGSTEPPTAAPPTAPPSHATTSTPAGATPAASPS